MVYLNWVRSTAAALSCVSLSLAFVAPAAVAQDYPNKPIRVVVPYPPAGGTDNIARLLSDKLTTRLNRPVVVENRPGANGNIGADAVAKSPADGYTLLFAGLGPLAVNPNIFAKMPYEPTKAFAPVIKVSSAPLVMVAGPSMPFGSVRELVAFAKANPGKLFAGNAGEGSPQHICAGQFAAATGAPITHVPYRGAAPAITDLLGGSVGVICENVGTIRPFIESKKVRPLAVSTARRSSLLPNSPTLVEEGVPGFDFSLWFMLVAPAGTPPAIVEMLNAHVNEILKMPDVLAKLADNANEPAGGSVKDAQDYLRAENQRWPAIVEKIGLAKQE